MAAQGHYNVERLGELFMSRNIVAYCLQCTENKRTTTNKDSLVPREKHVLFKCGGFVWTEKMMMGSYWDQQRNVISTDDVVKV